MNDRCLDRIHISGLRVFCKLGARSWEEFVKREVRIDLTLQVDLRQAACSDNLKDTVDYGTVASQVIKFTERSDFKLLEALAEGIAGVCLAFPHVEAVGVRVEKMAALGRAEQVAVEIVRPTASLG